MTETTIGDLYAVLGVARDASAREIRREYRRLARQHHPDLNHDPDGAGRFANIAHAYAVLHDPGRRAAYDRSAGRPPAPVDVVTSTRDPMFPPSPVVRRGVLELSRAEAAHVARRPLTLRDLHGHAIVLPAGTLDGDQITVSEGPFSALLTVRLAAQA
jgi:curved DNA-binding protein CbpA